MYKKNKQAGTTGDPRYSRFYVVILDLLFAVLLFTFKYFWNLTTANNEGNLLRIIIIMTENQL